MPEQQTIAIIGAGYSGALTAVNLLLADPPDRLRVVLIEQAATPGRGLAYRFGDDNLLLNVPAGNMSALADEPNHFVAWCQDIDPAFNAKSFISRRLYGEYLEFTLAAAARSRPGMLQNLAGTAVAVRTAAPGRGFSVDLDGGGSLEAAQVVLAFGHFNPRPPEFVPTNLRGRLIDPWDFGTLDRLDDSRSVALLGMGHTAIDALFRLSSCNAKRKIYLVSRRGLLPHSHRFIPNPPTVSEYPGYLAGLPPSVSAYTRAVRAEVLRREADSGNWRDVINELRPYTARLWQGLCDSERRRFLRLVVPYWDIHRHRLAPAAARRLDKLLESGQAEQLAGRVVTVGSSGDELDIQVRSRSGGGLVNLRVGAMVNCTGPNYDLSLLTQPLARQLLAAGLIQQDPLKIGLLVDDDYRMLDAHHEPNPGLFYVGPMLKAKYWEAIAVPELRLHTRQLAHRLLSRG